MVEGQIRLKTAPRQGRWPGVDSGGCFKLHCAELVRTKMSPRNQTEKVERHRSRQNWGTPLDLFRALNDEFHFTLDVCATDDNAKCRDYYTPEMDGLIQPWHGRIWCNPPYGHDCATWVAKTAVEHCRGTCDIIVLLLPSSTDTRWFHNHVYGKAELRFIKGRLRFEKARYSAPFPSMLAIYRR